MLAPRRSSATEAVTECVGYHLYVPAACRRDSPPHILGETPVTNLKVRVVCSLASFSFALRQLYLNHSFVIIGNVIFQHCGENRLCSFVDRIF